MQEIRQRREGSLSVLAQRQQTTMRLPQTKLAWREPPWGPPDPTPFLGRKEGTLSSPKQPKEKHQQRESNLDRRKRSQRYSPLPPVAPSCVGCQPERIDL